MSKYLVITIDVEPDCSPNWRYSDPLTFFGVTKGIAGILQPMFIRHNACPTYLINNVVLEDAESVKTFQNLEGRFELGTHLHSEFIQPEKLFDNYAGKKGEANQCFLKPEVEFEKMLGITNLFTNAFGRKPTSFRAGRFSAGANTMMSLSALGYKVDTSVTPHMNWSDQTRESAVDYRGADEQPYFVKENSYLQADDRGKILEVPVSILQAKKYFVLNRPIWLRPYLSDFNGFVRIMNAYARKYAARNHVVFNMMFHNVEVLPKMSPYPQTEKETETYLQSLEALLVYCKNNDIKCVSLSELYDIYR